MCKLCFDCCNGKKNFSIERWQNANLNEYFRPDGKCATILTSLTYYRIYDTFTCQNEVQIWKVWVYFDFCWIQDKRSKCQFHLPFLNSARYGHSTQISSMFCVLTVTQRKLYLLIWYHSSGSPASWRAALNAFLSANRITQLIQNGGSPVAGTEVRTFWISWKSWSFPIQGETLVVVQVLEMFVFNQRQTYSTDSNSFFILDACNIDVSFHSTVQVACRAL